MKKYNKIICLLLAVCLVFITSTPVSAARKLTSSQKKNADLIAEIAIENWDTYGVLPSVAVTQAFIESTLGDHCRGNNLWGICSGAVQYGSVKEGAIAYLKVINNGYYKNAPFKKNYKTQLHNILYDKNGNDVYCQPAGNYYNDALWAIKTYQFDKYDEKLFKIQKQKKEEAKQRKLEKIRKKKEEKLRQERLKKQKGYYVVKYDVSVPSHAIKADKLIINQGAVCVYDKGMYNLYGIYDVIEGGRGHIIYSSDKSLDGKVVELDIHEEAKG